MPKEYYIPPSKGFFGQTDLYSQPAQGGVMGAWHEFMYGPQYPEFMRQGGKETTQTSIPSWFIQQYNQGQPGGSSFAATLPQEQPPGGVGGPGGPGGPGGNAPFNVTNVPLMTPEQETAYSGFMATLGPKAAEWLSGTPSYDTSDEAFGEFWQKSIYDPAEKVLEEETIPGIGYDRQGANYHSGVRIAKEAEAREGFAERMESQRARLAWQNELRKQQASMQANMMGMQSISPFLQALGMSQFSPVLWDPRGIPTEEQMGSQRPPLPWGV